MTCVHKVNWTVRPPEDCRFRLSVSHYKDRIVAPDEYTGATVVTPTDSEQVLATKDKLVRDDITINPAPAPDVEPLTIDSLTQQGTFLPTGDGFSQVTVEEDWDGTLYPVTDETDPLYSDKVFDSKHIAVVAGDTIIIEGYGRGRWVGFRGITTTTISSLPSTINIGVRSAPQFDYLRFRFEAVEDCIAVLAGTNGNRDGTHSGQVGYCFCGDYLRWKVIHASQGDNT